MLELKLMAQHWKQIRMEKGTVLISKMVLVMKRSGILLTSKMVLMMKR